jgi:hypothetical protein
MSKAIITLFVAMMCAAISSRGAKAFEVPGVYQFNSNSWIEKKFTDGHLFLCKPCESEIRLSISYGRTLNAKGKKTIEKGLKEWADSDVQLKAFGRELLEPEMPPIKDVELKIEKAGIAEHFGIQMFQFASTVKMLGMVLKGTNFFGIHQERIVNITINYRYGDLDETASSALDEALGSLVFFR